MAAGTYGIEKLGIEGIGKVHYNLSAAELVEHALSNGEGRLAANGAFNVIPTQTPMLIL